MIFDERANNQTLAIRKRKIFSGIALAGAILIFSHSQLISEAPIPQKIINFLSQPLVIFGLSLPLLFWVGDFIFIRSFQSLRKLELNPEILLAVSLLVGFIYSSLGIFYPEIFIRSGVVVGSALDRLAVIVLLALCQDWWLGFARQRYRAKTNPETLVYLGAKSQTKRLAAVSLLLAPLASFTWFYFGALNFASALDIFLGTLVIAGVYLFLESSPIVIAKAKDALEKNGIIVRFDWALEAFLHTKTIVFNKTNTLTEGNFVVSDIVAARPKEILGIAAALEQNINHPLAVAITNRAKNDNLAFDRAISQEYLSGKGVSGLVNGKRFAVGTMKLMGEQGVVVGVLQREKSRLEAQGKTVVIIGRAEKGDRFNPRPGEVLGMIGLTDTLRPSARTTMAGLRKLGINTIILTSDGQRTAEAIGSELKIPAKNIFGDLTQEEKKEKLAKLRSGERMLTYVGSNEQDIALAGTVDLTMILARESRDFLGKNQVVIVGSNLNKIVDFRHIAQSALKRIGYNLRFALVYNWLALPLGAGILQLSTYKLILNPGTAMAISFAGWLVSLGSSIVWKYKK